MSWVYLQNDSIQNAGNGRRLQVGIVGGLHMCCKEFKVELRTLLTEQQVCGGYHFRHHMHGAHGIDYA